jgi:hypothetical protein
MAEPAHGSGSRVLRRALGLLLVAAAAALAGGCTEQHGLLLTVRAQPSRDPIGEFDLRVKEIVSWEVILERVGEKVDPQDPNRDISVPGQELKVAVEFAHSGNYLVYLQGRSGAETQFALRDFEVNGIVEKTVELNMLLEDADGDGYPPCDAPHLGFNCPPTSCRFLDCDDGDPTVHPFAKEVCGDLKDNDCDKGCDAAPGAGDIPCVDADGDKVPADRDCDDNDPCRSPEIPEAKNLCGRSAADWDVASTKACRDSGASFAPPLCGDGVDQDCDDRDPACFPDDDCDGYTTADDCDDSDAQINPTALEACDGVDNNCNKMTDEGCVPCDVDGDQHALKGTQDPTCTLPDDDPDDFDAGIHPLTTADTGGLEGGTLLTALREFCSGAPAKNGLTHREVDHDGDGSAAKDDGCPTATCDVDGDGFEGAQCSPPASKLDCNDNDPHTFPGAPERCGDGVAQNCVSDSDCSCDGDDDKYCPPNPGDIAGDCNDGDPAVHPWAPEICDKVDNDCDGLFDEGNPDGAGTPMDTDTKSCNDDNDGECAPNKALSGVCACSALKPNTTRDEGNRVACPDEKLDDPASPRCFGALQPTLEACDDKDHNCDGKPFVANEPFAGKGSVCGVDTGACASGTVEDCDLSQTVDPKIVEVLGAEGTYNPGWVCSTDTVFPVAEKCNGRDDDCDGLPDGQGTDLGWKEIDEQDADGDLYLGCTGCNPAALPAPLKGCEDCDDDNPGVGVCLAPLACCSKHCRNLKTDPKNCGSCDKVCNADDCELPVCDKGVCSTVHAPDKTPCTDGLCYDNACCTGCWDGSNCQPGTDDKNKCGMGGEPCQKCKACNDGVCE